MLHAGASQGDTLSRLANEFPNASLDQLRRVVAEVATGIDNVTRLGGLNLGSFGNLCHRLGGSGRAVRVLSGVTFKDQDTGRVKTFWHTSIQSTVGQRMRLSDPLRNALSETMSEAIRKGYRPTVTSIAGPIPALVESGRVEIREVYCL